MKNKTISFMSLLLLLASMCLVPKYSVAASSINGNEGLEKNSEVHVILERKLVAKPNISQDNISNPSNNLSHTNSKYKTFPQTREATFLWLQLLGIVILCLLITFAISNNKSMKRYGGIR